MRFEEDASESIVFVVPERSPAPNVLYLSSGMPKDARTENVIFLCQCASLALVLKNQGAETSENVGSERWNHYVCSSKRF